MPPTLRLGVNTCFAAKRWPEPSHWAALVTDRLGLSTCQVSLDLVDPGLSTHALDVYADEVREAAEATGLELHSTFTGLAAYAGNQLLHPIAEMRDAASRWFDRAIDLTARMGAKATGGFVGALSRADAEDTGRRALLLDELAERMRLLAAHARRRGLEFLLMENMAVLREPGSRIEEAHQLEDLLEGSDVPWRLCLDVGHPASLSTGTASDDPVAWLTEQWRATPVLQLQQANREGDHHWPFTPPYNAVGLVRAESALAALASWPDDEVTMFFEVVHPAEADDARVLADLEESVAYWTRAMSGRR